MNTLNWNRRRYTAYAPFYDVLIKPLAEGRRRSIEMLALQAEERVLLVGVGTGADIPLLPSTVHLTAIDLTPAMLRRSLARTHELQRPLNAAVMNAEQLGLRSECFDVVMLHLVLAVVPDPIACIREAARMLRPGGRVVIFDKFLPDTVQASLLRRVFNVITATLFSDINRQLVPLLAAANLHLAADEAVGRGSAYRIALAIKTDG